MPEAPYRDKGKRIYVRAKEEKFAEKKTRTRLAEMDDKVVKREVMRL